MPEANPNASGLVYMDHATTTPVHPDVLREMMPFFSERFGSPSQIYSLGQQAAECVQEARLQTSRLIGARAKHIYFTSGATEANNWAVKGAALKLRSKGRHIITSATEHSSILDPCKQLEKQGVEVTVLPVDRHGVVSPDDVKSAITEKTILITVGHGNIEVGTINPIADIGAIARERGVLFHTNAAQTAGKIEIDVEQLQCDLLSFSAHKFYGPKGVGALFMAEPKLIAPLHQGGSQERNIRGGTHNVPGIIGMGKAAELALANMAEEAKRIHALRDRLRDGLLDRIKNIQVVGHPAERVPGNLAITVDGVEGEAMLLSLDMDRICASSGSACTAGTLDPSHVLLAMGLSHEQAHGSIRFSLGAGNTEAHVDHVVECFPRIVDMLRKMSPTYPSK
ncbi:MAG: aminotransferase class V-fold PLP-dependent enzyme [Planctomycetes bacterium]|nr:aminotransferase class V-fold PLP-dependent enzyme [Planctomycetota bacterium]